MNRYLLSGLICFAFAFPAFGSQEENANPCPMALLDAILSGQEDVVAMLLERGSDPDASLENCEFPLSIPAIPFGRIYFYQFTERSRLFHVAAGLAPRNGRAIYDHFKNAHANPNVLDHNGRTPYEVRENASNNRHYLLNIPE